MYYSTLLIRFFLFKSQMNTHANIFTVPADYKSFPCWMYLQQIRQRLYFPSKISFSEHVLQPEASEFECEFCNYLNCLKQEFYMKHFRFKMFRNYILPQI